MLNIADSDRLGILLGALDEQLEAMGSVLDLVVVGGSALIALDVGTRPTADVDVLALKDGPALRTVEPLPPVLLEAAQRVARDFGLPASWLNGGPTKQLFTGLPDGFADRLEVRSFGKALTVHFASRLDLIHLKLYALVDQGPGKHAQDIRALNPSQDELRQAARWIREQDSSPSFAAMVERALSYLGADDADR